jgi:hypothetical protein
MSSNSLRLIAVAVALIIAVLTGAATGLLSGGPNCPATTTAATAPPTTAAGGAGTANKGDGGTPVQPEAATTTAAVTNVQALEKPACTEREAFGAKPALTAFVGALFVGAALLLLLLLSSRRPASVPAPAGSRTPGGSGGGGQAEADRRALVQASIYVRDRVTSKALGDRLGAALQDAGVTILEPAGVRFDPAHHEAGGATPSNDPALNGQISGVEVPGYVDRDGRVLRAPIVTVYQSARTAGGPTGSQPTVGLRGSPQSGQHSTQQPRREQPR